MIRRDQPACRTCDRSMDRRDVHATLVTGTRAAGHQAGEACMHIYLVFSERTEKKKKKKLMALPARGASVSVPSSGRRRGSRDGTRAQPRSLSSSPPALTIFHLTTTHRPQAGHSSLHPGPCRPPPPPPPLPATACRVLHSRTPPHRGAGGGWWSWGFAPVRGLPPQPTASARCHGTPGGGGGGGRGVRASARARGRGEASFDR